MLDKINALIIEMGLEAPTSNLLEIILRDVKRETKARLNRTDLPEGLNRYIIKQVLGRYLTLRIATEPDFATNADIDKMVNATKLSLGDMSIEFDTSNKTVANMSAVEKLQMFADKLMEADHTILNVYRKLRW